MLRHLVIAPIGLVLGMSIFYFVPVSSVVLDKLELPGKLNIAEAKAILSEAGYKPQYGWYQIADFQPVIIVMTDQNRVKVHAFTGEIIGAKRQIASGSGKIGPGKAQTSPQARVLDTTPQILEFIWPTDGAMIEDSLISVKISVRDETKMLGAWLQVLDAAGNIQSSYTFQNGTVNGVRLKSGLQTLLATVKDKSSNVTTKFVTITKK